MSGSSGPAGSIAAGKASPSRGWAPSGPAGRTHAPLFALAAGARCGLSIPETLITNDPDEARAFIESLPGRVAAYKALGTEAPSDIHGEPYALWTTQVRATEITHAVSLTAHQFQRAERKPDASWLRAMVEAAQSWASHRGVSV